MVNVIRVVYNTFLRRGSTFVLTMVVGAVFFERLTDKYIDMYWEHLNKGKLWKHIEHKYREDS